MDKKILVKYISGFVLGDGAISRVPKYTPMGKPTKRNSIYYIKQTFEHLDYLEWQQEILENLTDTRLRYTNGTTDKRGYTSRDQWELKSLAHPFFNKIRNRMYLNSGRAIDPHYMRMMDWNSLATLYMDDGWIESKETSVGTWNRVSIATMRYSYADNKMLRDFIAERFSIHFKVSKKTARSGEIHYYLRCTKDNANRFLDGVEKYIFPSYQYKIPV